MVFLRELWTRSCLWAERRRPVHVAGGSMSDEVKVEAEERDVQRLDTEGRNSARDARGPAWRAPFATEETRKCAVVSIS